jgi:3-methyladenine DNA glycosylase/8-oxoguanine DNA glycosylase
MLYQAPEKVSRDRFEIYRRRYSPYGSAASLYLWAIAGGALLIFPIRRPQGADKADPIIPPVGPHRNSVIQCCSAMLRLSQVVAAIEY